MGVRLQGEGWRAVQHEVPIQSIAEPNNEVLRDMTMDGEGLHRKAKVSAVVLTDHGRGDNRPRTPYDRDQRTGEVLLGCL
jgi:hypothetical protein